MQSLVAQANWEPGFVHPCSHCSIFLPIITEVTVQNLYTLNVSEITYKFRIVAIFPNFDFQNLVLMRVFSMSLSSKIFYMSSSNITN